ncbi:MAG: M23 family metallopeptidase [Bacteroidetes bacterium]|nr:MAG: M23 family metallopeptidase [Bacteroidota bacterium]
MWSFFSEFIHNLGNQLTVIVMDHDGLDPPRKYSVRPGQIFGFLVGSVILVTITILSLLLFTPIRGFLPGYGTIQMRSDARLNQLRLRAMEDTLAVQAEYVNQLRDLMMGTVDTSSVRGPRRSQPVFSIQGDRIELASGPTSADWKDHEQPALPLTRLSKALSPSVSVSSIEARYLLGLRFPVLPPVTGIVTRGFDARTGHYAMDVAVKEGSVVRAIGDGYVIMADWTHDGGQIIAIQHADGFVSVYKHNSRLLKRLGNRVRDREAVALSGNSGEITTGPHLHFELWHNGLAQDPNYYVIGM